MARITISLHDDQDADVLAWIKSQANQSAAIRDAIRASLSLRGPDPLARIADALERVAERMNGQIIARAAEGDAPGTERAAVNLRKLGL